MVRREVERRRWSSQEGGEEGKTTLKTDWNAKK